MYTSDVDFALINFSDYAEIMSYETDGSNGACDSGSVESFDTLRPYLGLFLSAPFGPESLNGLKPCSDI